MHRNPRFGLTAVVFGLAAVSGCEQAVEPVVPPPEPTSPVAAAAPISATYVCDSGLTAAVAYPDPQSAQVTYRDRTYALRGAPAASGARYVDAEVEWRSFTRDGVESATLSRLVAEDAPVVMERCSRPASAAPPVAPANAAPVVSLVAPAPGAGLASVSAASGSPPPCKGPQLKLSADGGEAGAGSRVSIFGVQNIGAQACSLTGYPTVILQDRQNRDLTDIRVDQAHGSRFRAGQIPDLVRLEPQGKAFFDIAWTATPDENQGQRTCASVARIRMTAPGDTSPVSLNQTLNPCGGRVRVSPFHPTSEPVAEPEPSSTNRR